MRSSQDESSSSVELELENYHDDPLISSKNNSTWENIRDRLPFSKGKIDDDTEHTDWKTPIFYIFLGLLFGWLVIPRGTAVQSASVSEASSSKSETVEVPKPPTKPVYPASGFWGYRKPDVPQNKACDLEVLSQELIEELYKVEEPWIDIVHRGNAIDTTTDTLTAGDDICLLVTLPQPQLPEDAYINPPSSLRGPDSIHLYLNSSDIIITLPPLIPLQNQSEAYLLHTKKSIIYHAPITLMHNGTYEIVGEREFSSWRWEQQHHTDMEHLSGITPLIGTYPDHGEDPFKFDPQPLPPLSVKVGGDHVQYRKPTCDATLNAAQGRWYKASSFPKLLHTDANLVDEWGYTWQGDHCELDSFSPHEAFSCLANKNIHFYGDSNGRRLLKSMITGGRWCQDVNAKCQNEDDDPDAPVEKIEVDELGHLNASTFERGMHFQGNFDGFDMSEIKFGRNSSVFFSFVTKITNDTSVWMDKLYAADDLIKMKHDESNGGWTDREIKEGATPRQPEGIPAADLAVLVPGSWDEAFTERFNEYERRMYQLKDAFMGAYEDSTKLLRTGNQFCCRMPSNFRRFNGQRIGEFEDRLKKIFNVFDGVGLFGKIRVVDPSMMNGRPDVLFDYGESRANHPRASHVRMEWQMMMNSLCQRDLQTGAVSFREQVD